MMDSSPNLSRRALLLSPFLLHAGSRTDRAAAIALSETAPVGLWNLSGKPPFLIVHYLPWFAITGSARETKVIWDHWKWEGPNAHHDPEKRRPDGLRDIDSVFYPLIGPYNAWSPNVLRYHLETIKAMGADAVALDWYAPGHFTDTVVRPILDEARRVGLKVTLCYEEKINFVWPDRRDPKTRAEAIDNATGDLKYLLTKYATHPAFLRRNGEPFFFQFNGWGEGKLGPRYFTPPEYETIFARLGQPVSFGRQGLDPGYATTAACRFLWWSAEGKAIRGFANAARRMIDDNKAQFWMSFVSPGFDDTGVWGWNNKPRVTPRKGLSFLYGTVENALVGAPELVQAVTWNDFQEGTVFEPTREVGFQYVDALAMWWAQKTGRPAPDLQALRAPFLHYAAHCTPAERAELPAGSYDEFLKPRPLTVEDPAYLEQPHG